MRCWRERSRSVRTTASSRSRERWREPSVTATCRMRRCASRWRPAPASGCDRARSEEPDRVDVGGYRVVRRLDHHHFVVRVAEVHVAEPRIVDARDRVSSKDHNTVQIRIKRVAHWSSGAVRCSRPQSRIAVMAGSSDRPRSVRVYSTRTGVSLTTVPSRLRSPDRHSHQHFR